MPETCKLPTASLRAPNRHPSSTPNRNIHQETMPNSRSAESDRIRHNATGYDRAQRKLVPARAHARVRGNGVPFPFPRHGLRPGRIGFLELPSPIRHANRSNETSGAKPLTEFLLMY